MVIATNEVSSKAMGGTELMALGLSERMHEHDRRDFQIVCSRVRELDDFKFRIFWAHDLPGDPESEFLAKPGLHTKFDHYVFVSNWQFWAYANHYKLPLERCSVIPNAITPIPTHEKPEGRINLIYYSTPHRGLEILVPAFYKLYEKYGERIHLDVYSSFNLYGWGQRDEPYKPIFDAMDKHPGITNHGSQPNSVIREALQKAHILAYPNIWQETSCLVLIEAMSAGLHCVHSNLAALPETSAGLTQMYPWHPDKWTHEQRFREEMERAIDEYDATNVCTLLSKHAKLVHGWEEVLPQWERLFDSIRAKGRPAPIDLFTIKVP